MELALICGFWARTEIERPERPLGKAGRIGNRVHKLCELHFNGGDSEPMGDAEEEREAQRKWASLKVWLGERVFQAEIGLLYDVIHRKTEYVQMGPGGDRDYLGVTSHTIPMRLDLLRIDGTKAEIIDIKTGSASNVQPAEYNAQLKTAALAVSRMWPDLTAFRVGLAYPLLTKVNTDYSSYTRADLDEYARVLRATMLRLPVSEPAKGQHCWKCPIGPSKGFVSTCPAWADEQERSAAE